MIRLWWWAAELVPVPRALALGLYLWAAIHVGVWIVSATNG